MKKMSSTFVCQECGYESSSWLGKCPECGNWNSLKEFQLNSKFKIQNSKLGERQEPIEPKTLDQVSYSEKERVGTGFLEMDTVMGGGIVKGSVILLAGDPGIGKSTLLLQTALNISRGPVASFPPVNAPAKSRSSNAVRVAGSPSTDATPILSKSSPSSTKVSLKALDTSDTLDTLDTPHKVLYISGEESEEQIKLRANRITNGQNNQNFLLLSLTDSDAIVSVIEKVKPSLVIIDSIQTVESANTSGLSGSVAQVRYSAFAFIRAAKTLNIPVIIVGHVTKEGMVAGPMILSHMVDTVLFLEGEKFTKTRVLRSLKNRFGPIDEVGIFLMEGEGMNEVRNPEQIFLSKNEKNTPGSVLVAILEGTRPFLVEVQALVNFTKLPIPRHVTSGLDSKRVELLLAVLQKHCRVPLNMMDVFVNVAGGIKVNDPAVDLGVCLAIFSSFKNISLSRTVGIAEVGLLGELRKVPSLEKRTKEAQKLGFDRIITSESHSYLNEVIKALEKK